MKAPPYIQELVWIITERYELSHEMKKSNMLTSQSISDPLHGGGPPCDKMRRLKKRGLECDN